MWECVIRVCFYGWVVVMYVIVGCMVRGVVWDVWLQG